MKCRLEIDVERCKGCGLCVWACPKDVLEMTSGRVMNDMGYVYAVVKDKERCSGCGGCFEMCGDYCITVFRD